MVGLVTGPGRAKILTVALVALVCALSASAPGHADAATPFRQVVASTEGQLASDGERFAAIHKIDYDNPRPPLVFDTLRGRRFRPRAPTPECRFVGIGGGLALWSCFPPQRTLISNLSSGLTRAPVGMDHIDAMTNEYNFCLPSSIGRHWLDFSCGGGLGPREDVYLNHRTGKIADVSQVYRDRRQPFFDLNYKGLARDTCRPLRWRDVTVFSPPFGLEFDYGETTTVRLRRCGRERAETLTRCRSAICVTPHLASHYVTWGEGDLVFAYLPRIRRRVLIGRAPVRVGAHSLPRAVAHTCNRIFVQWPSSAYRVHSVWVARFEPRRGAPPCQANR
jgi:hypothetical protein